MWKSICRKSTIFLGLSIFQVQNPHVINICDVEYVENKAKYKKLYFSVMSIFRIFRALFSTFSKSLRSATFFSVRAFVRSTIHIAYMQPLCRLLCIQASDPESSYTPVSIICVLWASWVLLYLFCLHLRPFAREVSDHATFLRRRFSYPYRIYVRFLYEFSSLRHQKSSQACSS